jgi:hypothetical protein
MNISARCGDRMGEATRLNFLAFETLTQSPATVVPPSRRHDGRGKTGTTCTTAMGSFYDITAGIAGRLLRVNLGMAYGQNVVGTTQGPTATRTGGGSRGQRRSDTWGVPAALPGGRLARRDRRDARRARPVRVNRHISASGQRITCTCRFNHRRGLTRAAAETAAAEFDLTLRSLLCFTFLNTA